MSEYVVTDTELESVADAIRTKGGTQADLEFPSGFVTAIRNISGGGSTLVSKTITENGVYDPADDNADGYDEVTVNVAGSAEPKLPNGYQEVEYISCSGTQYITINTSPKGMLVSIDVSQDAISSSEAGFAGSYASSSYIAELYLKNGIGYAYSKSPSIDNEIISNVIAGTRYRFGYVFLTNVSEFNIGTYRAGMYPFTGKIYRAELIDANYEYGDNVKRILLIPCYRKSDNVIGMYDVINGNFYTNVGTGNFGKGADVTHTD